MLATVLKFYLTSYIIKDVFGQVPVRNIDEVTSATQKEQTVTIKPRGLIDVYTVIHEGPNVDSLPPIRSRTRPPAESLFESMNWNKSMKDSPVTEQPRELIHVLTVLHEGPEVGPPRPRRHRTSPAATLLFKLMNSDKFMVTTSEAESTATTKSYYGEVESQSSETSVNPELSPVGCWGHFCFKANH